MASKKRERIRANAIWVREYKTSQGLCGRCLQRFHPHVLQFHHVRFPKIGNVSDMVQDGYSLDVIKEEIAKCELICANCHALENALRREQESAEAACDGNMECGGVQAQ